MKKMLSIAKKIAEELAAKESQIVAAIELLDDGSTVPFIARYRKEKTGGLDDTQLRTLEERLNYLRELNDRRDTIIEAIKETGKLTPELLGQLNEAETKTRLEDLYLPYKKKRVTKAQIARDAGIEPLAFNLLNDPTLTPEVEAEKYINVKKGFEDTKKVLDGARQILMEHFSENADLLQSLRSYLEQYGFITSKATDEENKEAEKYKDYFGFSEKINKIPSHRALALFRGRNEGFLQITINAEEDGHDPCLAMVEKQFDIKNENRPADKWLVDSARMAWKIKIHTKLDMDLKSQIKSSAEDVAIKVFSENLRDLLLASPAGPKSIIGLDPGLRTGVKVAVINQTGKLEDTDTIYPHAPQNQWDKSIQTLKTLCEKHKTTLIAIGNGTASRETDKLVNELKKKHPEINISSIVVSEAGASVYSASEFAAKEFPNIDVSLRGAVSIARRLQDPLAELVKIDPKSIGVGQYQHDVNQTQLTKTLGATTEDCVNSVGVDLNTASAPLLEKVSGLNKTIASNIIEFRDTNGAFKNRKQLKKVPRLGEKAFEQCAGFLRIRGGDNPLDNSSVHPEAYEIVKTISQKAGVNVAKIIGNTKVIKSLDPKDFVSEQFGLPTINDILGELEKPGRDPRPQFKTATFKEGVEKISDLKEGMKLEGVISNVTNFGAFVDIGVHQDGLVHISQLSDTFVKDPREVVKAGDIVNVTVIEIDQNRKRISLTMKSGSQNKPESQNNGKTKQETDKKQNNRSQKGSPNHKSKNNTQNNSFNKSNFNKNNFNKNSAFADAFKKAGLNK